MVWTACLDKKGQVKGFVNCTNFLEILEKTILPYTSQNFRHVDLKHPTRIIEEFIKSQKIHEQHLASAVPRLKYNRKTFGKKKKQT
uniref:Uncharacterized protein n=1 Tax=Octopus bimaculoides TaxID=37653 RepID=A0A0L8HDP8_OCTBM